MHHHDGAADDSAGARRSHRKDFEIDGAWTDGPDVPAPDDPPFPDITVDVGAEYLAIRVPAWSRHNRVLLDWAAGTGAFSHMAGISLRSYILDFLRPDGSGPGDPPPPAPPKPRSGR